jgi:hypothetical protein
MEFLPVLDVFPPSRQRRWTVLLRLILLIPQLIVVWVLGIVAAIIVFFGWFGALFLGRLPGFALNYLGRYLAYELRVQGYGMLLVDRYPPFSFTAPDYPVQIGLQPGPLNRAAVFFRLLLVIPAAIVQGVVYSGWIVCAFVIWLIVLIRGSMPRSVFQAAAAVLRFTLRVEAYMYLLTSAYPKRLLGDQPIRDYDPSWGAASSTCPLVLTGGAQGLLVLFIVLGVLANIGSGVGGGVDQGSTTMSVGRDLGTRHSP